MNSCRTYNNYFYILFSYVINLNMFRIWTVWFIRLSLSSICIYRKTCLWWQRWISVLAASSSEVLPVPAHCGPSSLAPPTGPQSPSHPLTPPRHRHFTVGWRRGAATCCRGCAEDLCTAGGCPSVGPRAKVDPGSLQGAPHPLCPPHCPLPPGATTQVSHYTSASSLIR